MPKDGNHSKEINLESYDDGGVSLREMKIGLWLSERRLAIIRLVTIFLIAVSAFFFVFSTYQYVRYFLAGDPNDQTVTGAAVTSPRRVTEDLITAPLQAFAAGDKTDLAVKVKNPNDKFMATFNYCFRQGDSDLDCQEGFILPAEEKYILSLGRQLSGQEGISFEIREVFWRRIDARKISDWSAYAAERLDLPVTGLNFSAAERSGLSEKINLNYLSFVISNETPYSYYEAPLDILFFSGGQLVGANRHLAANLLAGESREIKLSWPGDLDSVTRTEIKPAINIMDDSVYLRYRGDENR